MRNVRRLLNLTRCRLFRFLITEIYCTVLNQYSEILASITSHTYAFILLLVALMSERANCALLHVSDYFHLQLWICFNSVFLEQDTPCNASRFSPINHT